MTTTPRWYPRGLLNHDQTHVTTLLAVCGRLFGTAFLGWAPVTLAAELDAATGESPDTAAMDGILTGVVMMTSNRFYVDLPFFVEACNQLSGESVNPGLFDLAGPAECAWGVAEGMLIGPPPDVRTPADNPFNEDITGYVRGVLDAAVMGTPPRVLAPVVGSAANPGAPVAHDPALFATVATAQLDKTDQVDRLVEQEMKELVLQLEDIKREPHHHQGPDGASADP